MFPEGNRIPWLRVSDLRPVFVGFAVPLSGKVEKVVEDWIVAVVVIAVV